MNVQAEYAGEEVQVEVAVVPSLDAPKPVEDVELEQGLQ